MNAVVTGGSRGIGKAIALNLASVIGSRIIITGRDYESLLKTSREVSSQNIFPYVLDMAAGEEKFREFELFVSETIGTTDILINNAGLLIKKNFVNLTEEDIELMMAVNFYAPARLIKLLIPTMKRGTHIVNIASMGGFQGSVKFPGLSIYSASKAAIANLTECLAAELSEKGIRVNCIAPGSVDTDMLKAAFPGYKAQASAEIMGRFIAEFALSASDLINGKVIPVSKGNP